MSKEAGLVVFDGAVVRMFVGFARWRAGLAAQARGRDVVVEQMLFDAGRSMFCGDLLAWFWRDEALEMDWLGDFLCDPATDAMMAVLQAPPAEVEYEEEDMLFTKSALVTTGTDMYDYS